MGCHHSDVAAAWNPWREVALPRATDGGVRLTRGARRRPAAAASRYAFFFSFNALKREEERRMAACGQAGPVAKAARLVAILVQRAAALSSTIKDLRTSTGEIHDSRASPARSPRCPERSSRLARSRLMRGLRAARRSPGPRAPIRAGRRWPGARATPASGTARGACRCGARPPSRRPRRRHASTGP